MTGLYVDSSALLKRVFIEPDSSLVRQVLRERSANGELLVASELSWVEVSRSLLRAGVADVGGAVRSACSGVARHPVDAVVMSLARTIGPAMLRSLDAIHLAAAISLGVEQILTFDLRLAQAAQSMGVQAIP